MNCSRAFAAVLVALTAGQPVHAAERRPTGDEVLAAMKPFVGPSIIGTPGAVDVSTLTGKVMAGYQGWFNTPGDGSGLGFRHYPQQGKFEPGHCCFDLWPDMSELSDDEKFATPFHHTNGGVAYVFSSQVRKTVLRHFQWMQQYGIDGVFVQRFVVETVAPASLGNRNAVLAHCREGANKFGRSYAVMYDLSGLQKDGVAQTIADWKQLVDRMHVSRGEQDRAYLRHRGKPVVAVWGVGFNDNRSYSLAECDRLVEFLKNDPHYGGNTVMLGVPTGWRTLDRDAVRDPALHATLEKVDVISPWTIGRYDSPEAAAKHALERWRPDIEWCRNHGQDYLPVVFPGFSWHNLRPASKLNLIPRRRGAFLWQQFVGAREAGATMVYQAMFDEIDEGTAIFKCTNDPPVGASSFVTYEGLPSEHYLWLTGMGAKLLRGEISSSDTPPERH